MNLLAKFDNLKSRLQALAEVGHNPFQIHFEAIHSATIGILDGRETMLFGTNNYLGLTFDPEAVEASCRAVREQGTGTTGSRVANGSYASHGALEAELATFFGRRHAMVFSTGYQANLGIISTLAGRGDHLILDADSHASIYDGARMGAAEVIRFRHNDPEDLAKRLKRLAGAEGGKLVVVEGIYSMLGDIAPLAELAQAAHENGAALLVDEAHSMGILGAHGRGLAEAVGVEDQVDFVVGTFSKSLGSVGGFCVSDAEDFDLLRLVCRPYMFTASLPPSVIASTRVALARLASDSGLRTRVMANAEHFYTGLHALGFQLGPDVSPVVAVTLETTELAVVFWNALLAAGVYLNLALPPATPTSRPLLRASVSAAHTPAQIDAAIDAYAQVGEQLGVLRVDGRVAAAYAG
ncbi:MAG: pyridoxal phosphate-dependent aminotransferase family protein [Nevskiaceae bacterium]|nr:MAG: pyridoxal phosphate-dependent aminotransferase family protein [Nevskiaceae bacterium]TBR74098.1 MAG: pyridoxal phosphate-dependent aminotransferase family protein [Nevskiaceae bacterium]